MKTYALVMVTSAWLISNPFSCNKPPAPAPVTTSVPCVKVDSGKDDTGLGWEDWQCADPGNPTFIIPVIRMTQVGPPAVPGNVPAPALRQR